MEGRWTLKGLNSSISTAEVPCRDLGCGSGVKSTMCRKLSEPVTSRARKRNIECVQRRREVETHDRDWLFGDEGLYAQQFSNQSFKHPEAIPTYPPSPPGMRR